MDISGTKFKKRTMKILQQCSPERVTVFDYQKSMPDVWYLCSIALDPSVHGQGIGTQFIAYMEDNIRARGGKQLILFTNSEKNLAFYRRRGFEVFLSEQIVHDGKVMGSWSMKKML